jgi:hypothetical protein
LPAEMTAALEKENAGGEEMTNAAIHSRTHKVAM